MVKLHEFTLPIEVVKRTAVSEAKSPAQLVFHIHPASIYRHHLLQAILLVQFIRPQTTIASSTSVAGFGFWSGLDVKLEFHPAVANSGVVFVRTDLPGQPRIVANIANRITGPRRTTLVSNECAVEMVEHVLSALAGMHIDNCEVHVNQAEMPGLDGSSIGFVLALQSAGKIELDATRQITHVTETKRIGNDEAWIEIAPAENQSFELEYHLDYPSHATIGKQHWETTLTKAGYCEQIAPARTFVLDSEAEKLRASGLGARVGYQDMLVFDQQGPIDNELRFDDECARHKVLDMIGDFSLIGTDIVGKFTAYKSGHHLNSQVALELLKQSAAVSAEPQPNKRRLSA